MASETKKNGNGKQLAPEIEPYSDEDLELLYRQEPLPPNQGFQLPAEEQPITKESEEYAEH